MTNRDNSAMTHENSLRHVYQRTVTADNPDSLSIIAQLIEPGQALLDLGMGTGGLGEFLSHQFQLIADGVTINQREADIAKTWYRRSLVADLETVNLVELLNGESYDCIVCADVLEHLKNPEVVLNQCKTLLKPGGRLIVSLPNVGYCGLIAEIIMGDFFYRPEGLLDDTHLRFFTRKSQQRLFNQWGWSCQSVQVTQRDLLQSEFKIPFDLLPPTVSRHLLALPDALTYQYISVLQPMDFPQSTEFKNNAGLEANSYLQKSAEALFSSALYFGKFGEYTENAKLVAAGTIGQAQQKLVFNIPASAEAYTNFRFDPADRPGFLKLHSLRISFPNDVISWEWIAGQNPLSVLSQASHQQMVISSSLGTLREALLFLHGDDPWIELPLTSDILAHIGLTGAEFEVCMGWPMSADYLQASSEINHLQLTAEHKFSQQAKSYQELLAKLTAEHNESLAKLTTQYNESLAKLTTEYNQSLTNLTKENKESLDKKTVEQEKSLAKLNREYQELTDKQATEHKHALAAQTLILESTLLKVKEAETSNIELVNRITKLALIIEDTKNAKLNAIAEKNAVAWESKKYKNLYDDLLIHLQNIERSTLFRITRPLVHFKMQVDRRFSKPTIEHSTETSTVVANPIPLSPHPVDIIVPVYRGLGDTRCCIESVLKSTCQTPYRLIVIDDCSPEPELSEWLRNLAASDSRVQLIVNLENLGFVATVNRGMELSVLNDVLLLNSDAEVANDWLDRIQRAAYSQPRVASVTPFSNNATICSYPRFCQANDLPAGYDTGKLDLLFAQRLSGQTVVIPTGVGFCMFIRRQCLEEIGLFDVARFGKGYGEENDFCVRAQKMGWVNLHALDTFVRHSGGISFGESKSDRELQAMATLRELHPQYESDVHSYLKADPGRRARKLIDIARITGSGKPVVMNVTHNRDGGTLRHIHEIEQQLRNSVTFLRLTPAPSGVTLALCGTSEAFELRFNLPLELDNFLETLRILQVKHIHFHHLLGHVQCVFDLPLLLGITHDFTAHDYYCYCPQISLTDHTDQYCGEKGLAQCHQCLQRNPAPDNMSIETWRYRASKLLSSCRFLFAPSQDTAQRIHKFVPAAHVQVVPHTRLFPGTAAYPQPKQRVVTANAPLKVVVLGALSKIKGADVLESVAALASSQKSPIEFHLIGFAYRSLGTLPKASLTVHGAYEDHDLPKLIQWLNPDVVWFPAVWPETYSYTLSACLEIGLPIIAPNIGAFSERLQNREWTWLCNWQQSASHWLTFFETIREHHFCTGISPNPVGAFAPTCAIDTTVDYFDNYFRQIQPPVEPELAELIKQRQLIESFQLRLPPPTAVMKSSALQAIVRLRATATLSPMTKWIPMHMQRRIKSWLKK